jgi:hypothetical protein
VAIYIYIDAALRNRDIQIVALSNDAKARGLEV